ncbi:MAG TPA: DUF2130 domain-containing protein [Gemmataceae bacterium]|jgi:hypothetical protein|nr:DUF2130 domain-containing protein [Gemmataceae bacterium]
MTDTIICPNCHCAIEVQAAVTAQLRERLQKELEADVRQKEHAIAARERNLNMQEAELANTRESIECEVRRRLAEQRTLVQEEAELTVRNTVAHEVHDLQEELTGMRTKVTEMQSAELELRKERRQLEDQKRELELTVNRTLDAERAKIRDDAKAQAFEETRLREADKDKLVGDLRTQIAELKRRSEVGTAVAQGEVLEVELESVLRQQFPFDTIEPVPVSFNGGDVMQHVFDSTGQACGTILWESKRTKSWNGNWLPKLRDDQRAAKAQLAALLTAELPKGTANFGCIDGTWVTNRTCLVGLAAALRAGLIETARARNSLHGKLTKVDLVFQYLAGAEFRQKVEGIVEAFVILKQDLDSEKRSFKRMWTKREKHIDRAVANTAMLYGELGELIGTKLPRIPMLELDGYEEPDHVEDEPAVV